MPLSEAQLEQHRECVARDGFTILESIIDAMGNVTKIKVLKGLPLGLTDSAVKATEQWKFKPATRNGVPVPVFFTLTIRFSLQ